MVIPFVRNKKLKAFIQLFIDSWKRIEIGSQSAEIAYYLLLALLPIILALANVIPLLPIPTNEVLSYVEMAVPADVGNVVLPILRGYLEGGSGGAISLGLIISFWPASKAFTVFQRVLNQVYNAPERSNFLISRIISFLTVLLLVAIVGVVAFFFVFGREILSLIEVFIPIDLSIITTFQIFRWIIAFVVFALVLSFVYFFVPNVKWPIKYSIPGGLFATFGFLLISQLFSLYVRFFGGSSVSNGTIGVFIILMLWLYLMGAVLILGAFINVLVYRSKYPEKVPFDKDLDYVEVYYSPQYVRIALHTPVLRNRLVKVRSDLKKLPRQGFTKV